MPTTPPHGFTDVDAQPEPQAWVEVLDKLRQEPFYAAYKRRIVELLQPERGKTYLEVGAGAGTDALAVMQAAACRVVALDASRVMAAEARRRGVSTAVVGDAHALPFTGSSFDGCWSDRTFQHLADPESALCECVRVVRPGGRLAVVDPDYGTQVLNFPDPELAEKVLRFRAEMGLRNGTLAHRMTELFEAAGLTEVTSEAMTLFVSDPSAVDNVMGLRTWAAGAAEAGYLARDEVERWERLHDETVAAGQFLYALTFFLTCGTRV